MTTEIAAVQPQIANALTEVEIQTKMFELAQRKANIYAKSSLVPKEYQNNVGNVLIATNMATRMNADILMVMQNLFIVHNRPGWSAQFLIATFNSCGRFSAIKYRFTGEKGKDSWGCIAVTVENSTGEVLEGTEITIGIAKAEGWYTKNGSKWRTIPEQMLRYRAATFLIRSTAPEIGMGLSTKEELEDMVIDDVTPHRQPLKGLDDLADRLLEPPASIPDREEPTTDQAIDEQSPPESDSDIPDQEQDEGNDAPADDDPLAAEENALFGQALDEIANCKSAGQVNMLEAVLEKKLAGFPRSLEQVKQAMDKARAAFKKPAKGQQAEMFEKSQHPS